MANKLCPSAPLDEAPLLLGIVGSNGAIEFFGSPVRINEEFRKIAKKGRIPEKRFRFAAQCIENKCCNWEQQECTISKKVSAIDTGLASDYAKCGIRSACRWFSQNSLKACKNCKFMITDTR